MSLNSRAYEPHQWQTSEYVDSWFANQARQTSYFPWRKRLVASLPFEPGTVIRVLDIGTGNGALSLDILNAYPEARLVCHDFSKTMLERARERLGEHLGRITFVQSDLRDPAWVNVIEGTFDAVVSSIAIHNVAESNQGTPERIREIYAEIFRLVKPGGCFLNYDITAAPGPMTAKIYHKEYLASGQSRPIADTGIVRNLESPGRESNEHSHRIGGQREYSYVRNVLDQLDWLRQAGFDEVDCFLKDNRNAIFGGFRH